MNIRRHRAILLAYLGMIVLLLLTSVVAPGFLSPTHLRSTAVLAAFIGIVALGQTFVIIGGGIDLSVPWVLNSAAVLMTLLAGSQDAPLLWIVPMLLAAGALVGMVNGLGVAIFGVPPIIMTLAVNVILQGGILVYTRSGFTAALAGMLLTGYTAQAYLGMGDPYLFTSIAAVAIGGASILGGSGHYIGTIAGALVLTILTGLLPALNLSSGALLIVYGVVILVTVSLASEALSSLFTFLPRLGRPRGPSA